MTREALRLVRGAQLQGLELKLSGSLAVGIVCSDDRSLLQSLGREPYGDIDLIGREKEWPKIDAFMVREGYTGDPSLTRSQEYGIRRLIFESEGSGVKVDVFLDRVVMSHTIDYRDRLAGAAETVEAADLVLSKLQIHDITEKDVIDLLMLLRQAARLDAGSTQRYRERVVGIVTEDWGFTRTALDNLATAHTYLLAQDGIDDALRDDLRSRVSDLEGWIEVAPKSRRWGLRARLGTRVRWYEPVEEVDR